MPKWDRQGGRVMTTLFECAAFQYTVRATCSCGHTNVFQPHALWWRFKRKGWDDRLETAGERLRCVRCSQGNIRLTSSRDDVTIDRLPLPPEGEWKKAINRLRN